MAAIKKQVAFRLPSELVLRIDRYWRALARRAQGNDVTRSDVVRTALTRGMRELEREARADRTAKKSGR